MIDRIDGVLCTGNISYDIPVWPVDSVAWGKSMWVDEITFGVGGNGANTSYAMATLGGRVRLTGMVGRDTQGEAVIDVLRDAGIELDLHRSDEPTTSTVVLVHSNSDRSFLHRPGASRDVTAGMLRFDVPGFTHFHLANPFSLPVIRNCAGMVMADARGAGLTTSLDTAWDAKGRWMEDIGPCLPHTDLLFVNDSEARMLTECEDPREAACILRGRGVKDIVVKIGSRGCLVFTDDSESHVPGFSVPAKDTTGAGDCFAGAFLAAISKGLPYKEAARIANAAGAMNVEHLGAARGVRPWEETLAWIRERDTL